jgi:hypothetical protein
MEKSLSFVHGLALLFLSLGHFGYLLFIDNPNVVRPAGLAQRLWREENRPLFAHVLLCIWTADTPPLNILQHQIKHQICNVATGQGSLNHHDLRVDNKSSG